MNLRILLTYVLSCIISELSRRICQIIASDRGCQVPLFNSIVRGESVNTGLRNLARKNIDITVSCGVQIFRYIELFRRGLPV